MTDADGNAARPVLLDTDVFSKVYVPTAKDAIGVAWAGVLAGRTVAIAVQTEVELRAWPRLNNWSEKRAAALDARITAVPRIPANELVQAAYIDLTVWAKQEGHGIQAGIHVADRWIAATAMAYGLELAAIDAIYDGVANLSLLKP